MLDPPDPDDDDDEPFFFEGEDKIAHVASFGALAVAIGRALTRGGRPLAVRSAGGVAAAATIAYGAALEGLQTLVGRTFTPYDLAANAVGVAVAVPLWLWLASA
jgi:VanZ family protein